MAEFARSSAWNPYMLMPVQRKRSVSPKRKFSKICKDLISAINSATTEIFLHADRNSPSQGAKPVTFTQFADWHRKNIGDPPMRSV
jgi:hypothetical protein